MFKEDETRKSEIKIIFEIFKVFEKRIRRIFEDIDQERTAEKQFVTVVLLTTQDINRDRLE